MIESVLFYCFSAVILISALLTVTAKNMFHAALYLASALLGVVAVFITLEAYFMAAIQVLIYIGAVVVLTIFVVNMTRKITLAGVVFLKGNILPAALTSVLTAVLIILAILNTQPGADAVKSALTVDFTKVLGKQLLGNFVIAFEVVSVLLLAALIAAITIVSRDTEEKK